MCGIFGLATKDTKSYNASGRKEIFLNGLLFNIPRGWDGTGICTVRELGSGGKSFPVSAVHKRSVHAIDFLGTKSAQRALDNFSNFHYVIGHTRASTRGVDNDANAHPFRYGSIVLAHNGTVETAPLPIKAEEAVDSASIAATMEHLGEHETLELLDGGFSLVWYNEHDDSLNLARNKRKPMSIAFTKEGDMFFASEWHTLMNVLLRNGREVTELGLTRPFVHYKFFKDSLKTYEQTTFKEYVRPTVSYPNYSTGGGGTQHSTRGPTESKTDTKTTTIPCPADIKMSEARLKVVSNLLQKEKLAIGSIAPMIPKSFKPFPRDPTQGILEGHLVAREHIRVTLYQIKTALWEQVSKNLDDKKVPRAFSIRITNIRLMGKTGDNLELVGDLQTEWSKRLLGLNNDGDFYDEQEDDTRNYHGPHGMYVTRKQFGRYAIHGCGECGGVVIGPDDNPVGKDVVWIGEGPICTSCQKDPVISTKLGIKPNATLTH